MAAISTILTAASVAVGVGSHIQSNIARADEAKERRDAIAEEEKAIAEEKAKALSKRKATIKKQRKQLMGSGDTSPSLTKTSPTGLASANILKGETLG